MKKIIKSNENITEKEKQEWLRNASAEDLLKQYDSLHVDTIKNYSYNPDYNLTRAELLRRLQGR